MSTPVIEAVGHVALQVTDLDAALSNATEVMGLRESGRADGCVYLTEGKGHHSLQLLQSDRNALDHVGLCAAGPEGLAEIRRRLESEGIDVIADEPLDEGIDDAVVFAGPGGIVFEAYVGMARGEPLVPTVGVRPTRFGHVTFTTPKPVELSEFLQRVLDFKISDYVGAGFFLRCNVDHHGIGVLPGELNLHHHAWEVESIVQLGRVADRLDDCGRCLQWGPLRHGAGNNIAVYFADPCGAVVEYYAEMERIYEDDHEPGVWDVEDGHRWYSMWAPGMPEGVAELGVPPVFPLAKAAGGQEEG